ncbi:hypothetical protein ABID94_003503 [Streptomyces sp. PvR018]
MSTLITVGVQWALGDAGAALEAGRGLHESQFTTPERKARMHTDLARAWWQWGKPEQTAAELLSALRAKPGEVRDRPAIRTIVTDLRTRQPRQREWAMRGPSAHGRPAPRCTRVAKIYAGETLGEFEGRTGCDGAG